VTLRFALCSKTPYTLQVSYPTSYAQTLPSIFVGSLGTSKMNLIPLMEESDQRNRLPKTTSALTPNMRGIYRLVGHLEKIHTVNFPLELSTTEPPTPTMTVIPTESKWLLHACEESTRRVLVEIEPSTR
jgi:hypothetical protein